MERNIAVQAAVQQQQLAAEEAERAKVAATHLLDLADQAAMVSIMYQVIITLNQGRDSLDPCLHYICARSMMKSSGHCS